ncbi:hypothetical protein BGW38_000849 [Lunasporangiospora selenospora]|uniref:Uncharacterized protein n=1 Tax=Lunasporangiospora selenospora TaxID=979761 RepID=A0A9P6G2E1_9FUNG|nr:hypothetical protein BGW38_000849 [Lunasporangiospora selenospora]
MTKQFECYDFKIYKGTLYFPLLEHTESCVRQHGKEKATTTATDAPTTIDTSPEHPTATDDNPVTTSRRTRSPKPTSDREPETTAVPEPTTTVAITIPATTTTTPYTTHFITTISVITFTTVVPEPTVISGSSTTVFTTRTTTSLVPTVIPDPDQPPPPPPAVVDGTESESHNGLKNWQMILIVVALLVFFAAIASVFLIAFMRKIKRQQRRQNRNRESRQRLKGGDVDAELLGGRPSMSSSNAGGAGGAGGRISAMSEYPLGTTGWEAKDGGMAYQGVLPVASMTAIAATTSAPPPHSHGHTRGFSNEYYMTGDASSPYGGLVVPQNGHAYSVPVDQNTAVAHSMYYPAASSFLSHPPPPPPSQQHDASRLNFPLPPSHSGAGGPVVVTSTTLPSAATLQASFQSPYGSSRVAGAPSPPLGTLGGGFAASGMEPHQEPHREQNRRVLPTGPDDSTGTINSEAMYSNGLGLAGYETPHLGTGQEYYLNPSPYQRAHMGQIPPNHTIPGLGSVMSSPPLGSSGFEDLFNHLSPSPLMSEASYSHQLLLQPQPDSAITSPQLQTAVLGNSSGISSGSGSASGAGAMTAKVAAKAKANQPSKISTDVSNQAMKAERRKSPQALLSFRKQGKWLSNKDGEPGEAGRDSTDMKSPGGDQGESGASRGEEEEEEHNSDEDGYPRRERQHSSEKSPKSKGRALEQMSNYILSKSRTKGKDKENKEKDKGKGRKEREDKPRPESGVIDPTHLAVQNLLDQLQLEPSNTMNSSARMSVGAVSTTSTEERARTRKYLDRLRVGEEGEEDGSVSGGGSESSPTENERRRAEDISIKVEI